VTPLPPGPFPIIYADPAWSYRGREQFGFAGDVGVSIGGAIKQYKTMTLADICRLPVSEVTERDALLFLWVTSPLLEDGLQCLHSWGFEFCTIGFVWEKGRINPGFYTLSSVELCLVGKQGRIPQPRGSRNERQFLSELRGEHSAKPDEVRARIERMFPTQRKLEMFARTRAAGWEGWGDEL
jgi:N6-adenosine-specific RNA methylase IME4